MNSFPNLAFLDFETTGFSPRKGDRILEAAIITTDWEGNVLDRFESLVNPMREVTGTEIHQLTAEMLSQAPRFAEIAEDLLVLLKDKVIIGHNLSFDLRFLEAELERQFRRTFSFEGLCTLQLSKTLFPKLPLRRLDALCEFLDIDLNHAHSAFGDCQATLSLFNRMRELTDKQPDFIWGNLLAKSCNMDFDPIPTGISLNRSEAMVQVNAKKSQFKELIRRLPADPQVEVSELQYLNLLDEVLADRLLTNSELNSLVDMLSLLGLSQSQVNSIHEDYLRNLCRVYWKDHVLSQAEKADLKVVAELLGVDDQALSTIIQEEEQKVRIEQVSEGRAGVSKDLSGKSICFTGALQSTLNGNPIDRGFAQRIAIEQGLIIKSGISKGLDYLVTADPNSLSGKSQKARDYGVKIIAEPVFWSWMNFKVD